MGVVIDSSILIAAEKQRLAITEFRSAHPEGLFYLAAISAAELLQGAERAAPAARKAAPVQPGGRSHGKVSVCRRLGGWRKAEREPGGFGV